MPGTDEDSFRCGYVGLIGRPNAGKSTLLNALLGNKLAITSAKPQTTRNRIVGIHSDDRMQIILVDTPGIHEAWTELNKNMVQRTLAVLHEVDLACWIGDMTHFADRIKHKQPVLDGVDEAIATRLAASGKPIVFVANKIDVVPHPLVLPVIDAIRERLPIIAAVPLSALTGDAIETLREEIRRHLPVGPALYPPDEWTQVTERFLVGEIVREKIFHLTEQEVPYATHVEVVQFDETERAERGLVRIYADIVVERDSQKGILIGKGGEMLKRIGTLARKELVKLLDCRVHLALHVKVERDWTQTVKGLRKVGFES